MTVLEGIQRLFEAAQGFFHPKFAMLSNLGWVCITVCFKKQYISMYVAYSRREVIKRRETF
jgi:hypothetical protein